MGQPDQCSRRTFLRRSAAMLAGIGVLTACGAAPQAQTPAAEEAAPQEEAPVAQQPTEAAPDPTSVPVPGKQTLRVVSGQDVTELEVRRLIGELFNEQNSGINVETVIVKGDRYDSQQLMIAGGNPPDVLYMNPGFMYAFASKNALLPLDEYAASDNINFEGILPTAVEMGRYQDKLIAMPFEVAPLTIVYNKKLFDDAGVEYPTTDWTDANWTWDAFVEMAKKLTNPDKKQFGAHIDNWMFPTFVFQNGGNVLSNSKEITPETKAVLDSPEAVEAVQWMVDLQTKHAVHATAAATAELGGFDRFMSGNVAMYVYGRWLNTFRTIKDFEWDVAALPHVQGKDPKTLLLDLHYGIYSGSKAADAAWEYLKFIITDRPQTENIKTGMAVAVLDKVNQSDDFLMSRPPANEQVYIDALKYAVPEEVNPATTGYNAPLFAELENVFKGTTEVAVGMKAATEAVNKNLEEWRLDNA